MAKKVAVLFLLGIGIGYSQTPAEDELQKNIARINMHAGFNFGLVVGMYRLGDADMKRFACDMLAKSDRSDHKYQAEEPDTVEPTRKLCKQGG